MKVELMKANSQSILTENINSFLNELDKNECQLVKMDYSTATIGNSIRYSVMVLYATKEEIRNKKLDYLLDEN